MSEITLEWFFQIPGLFITIGVLLILIALLVLIIGSSKAKNKKAEDLSLVDDVEEPVANSVEAVNVLEPNSINYLNGDNNLNVVNNLNSTNNLNNNLETNEFNNNLNNINSISPVMVNESVPVTTENSDTINPMIDNSSNIVTPVNISENIFTPVENTEKVIESVDASLPQGEPVIPVMAQPIDIENNIPNDNLSFQQPVFASIEAGVNDTSMSESNNLVQNINSEIKPEVTMAPIFNEPITPVENFAVPQVQEEVQIEKTINEPLNEGSVVNAANNINGNVPPIVEPMISNLNQVGTDFVEPMEPIKQKDLMVDNVEVVTPAISDVNDTVNPTPTVENGEVEEIL